MGMTDAWESIHEGKSNLTHVINVLLQVPELVAPLREDPQRVFQKGDDN
jgi:hypothetical protein